MLGSDDAKNISSGDRVRSESISPSAMSDDWLCEIATYLKQVRLEQGLSITDVAQRSSLPPAFIAAMERCDFQSLPETLPKGGCLQRYADALGIKGLDVSGGRSRRASAR